MSSLPPGWHLSGLHRFDETWIGLAEGPEFDDYASGSGLYAEQALRRLTTPVAWGDGNTWPCSDSATDCGSGAAQFMGDWRATVVIAGILVIGAVVIAMIGMNRP